MDTNKNSYTIIYSIVMVVLVAAVLAIVATGLKERQQQNIDMEKQSSILASVNLTKGADEADSKIEFYNNLYNKYIKAVTVDVNGQVMESVDAFKVDLAAQSKIIAKAASLEGQAKLDALKNVKLPVFQCNLNGEMVNIFPVYGPGLWGPIWGYVAVESDNNTIYGATFDHKGETPGLGAEIATAWFQEQFKGKQLFAEGTFSSVIVAKGGAAEGSTNEVDAISGGTITSKSLEKAIRSWIELYIPYMNSLK